MKLVILSAGMGTRIDRETPKSMLRVGGETIAERLIRQSGIADVVMVVGYRAEFVMRFFSDRAMFVYNPYWDITNSVGSLRMAGALYEGPAVIAYGDTVVTENDMLNIVHGDCNRIGILDTGSGVGLVKDGNVVRVKRVGDFVFAGVAKVSDITGFIGSAQDSKPVGSCVSGCMWHEMDSINVNTESDFRRAVSWTRL